YRMAAFLRVARLAVFLAVFLAVAFFAVFLAAFLVPTFLAVFFETFFLLAFLAVFLPAAFFVARFLAIVMTSCGNESVSEYACTTAAEHPPRKFLPSSDYDGKSLDRNFFKSELGPCLPTPQFEL